MSRPAEVRGNVHPEELKRFHRFNNRTSYRYWLTVATIIMQKSMQKSMSGIAIKDTQLRSHCSDTCLSLFRCCLVMVIWWNCPSSRPALRGKGKGHRAQHINVIPSIDPSSNVTDCSLTARPATVKSFASPSKRQIDNTDVSHQ